ncbi:MAG: hypothetical protein K9L68_01220 [Spirochaetales bacterium]|nr:hypothetical protein [Spirochaetales bacterium]
MKSTIHILQSAFLFLFLVFFASICFSQDSKDMSVLGREHKSDPFLFMESTGNGYFPDETVEFERLFPEPNFLEFQEFLNTSFKSELENNEGSTITATMISRWDKKTRSAIETYTQRFESKWQKMLEKHSRPIEKAIEQKWDSHRRSIRKEFLNLYKRKRDALVLFTKQDTDSLYRQRENIFADERFIEAIDSIRAIENTVRLQLEQVGEKLSKHLNPESESELPATVERLIGSLNAEVESRLDAGDRLWNRKIAEFDNQRQKWRKTYSEDYKDIFESRKAGLEVIDEKWESFLDKQRSKHDRLLEKTDALFNTLFVDAGNALQTYTAAEKMLGEYLNRNRIAEYELEYSNLLEPQLEQNEQEYEFWKDAKQNAEFMLRRNLEEAADLFKKRADSSAENRNSTIKGQIKEMISRSEARVEAAAAVVDYAASSGSSRESADETRNSFFMARKKYLTTGSAEDYRDYIVQEAVWNYAWKGFSGSSIDPQKRLEQLEEDHTALIRKTEKMRKAYLSGFTEGEAVKGKIGSTFFHNTSFGEAEVFSDFQKAVKQYDLLNRFEDGRRNRVSELKGLEKVKSKRIYSLGNELISGLKRGASEKIILESDEELQALFRWGDSVTSQDNSAVLMRDFGLAWYHTRRITGESMPEVTVTSNPAFREMASRLNVNYTKRIRTKAAGAFRRIESEDRKKSAFEYFQNLLKEKRFEGDLSFINRDLNKIAIDMVKKEADHKIRIHERDASISLGFGLIFLNPLALASAAAEQDKANDLKALKKSIPGDNGSSIRNVITNTLKKITQMNTSYQKMNRERELLSKIGSTAVKKAELGKGLNYIREYLQDKDKPIEDLESEHLRSLFQKKESRGLNNIDEGVLIASLINDFGEKVLKSAWKISDKRKGMVQHQMICEDSPESSGRISGYIFSLDKNMYQVLDKGTCMHPRTQLLLTSLAKKVLLKNIEADSALLEKNEKNTYQEYRENYIEDFNTWNKKAVQASVDGDKYWEEKRDRLLTEYREWKECSYSVKDELNNYRSRLHNTIILDEPRDTISLSSLNNDLIKSIGRIFKNRPPEISAVHASEQNLPPETFSAEEIPAPIKPPQQKSKLFPVDHSQTGFSQTLTTRLEKQTENRHAFSSSYRKRLEEHLFRLNKGTLSQQVLNAASQLHKMIDKANNAVSRRIDKGLTGAGYRKKGENYFRNIIIDQTFAGGTERKKQHIGAYTHYKIPVSLRMLLDFYTDNEPGLNDSADSRTDRYKLLVDRSQQSVDTINTLKKMIFADLGYSLRNNEGGTISSIWKNTDVPDSYQRLWEEKYKAYNSAGAANEHPAQGLFGIHVGYAPRMKDNDPGTVELAGYGEYGRIMTRFYKQQNEAGRGLARLSVPVYDMRIWDDDKNNDGRADTWFSSPSIRSVADVSLALLSGGAGSPLASLALGLSDDLLLSYTSSSHGYQKPDEALFDFGRSAVSAAASTATSSLFHSAEAVSGFDYTDIGLEHLVNDSILSGSETVLNRLQSSLINSVTLESGSIVYDDDTFRKRFLSPSSGAAIASALTDSTVTYGMDTLLNRKLPGSRLVSSNHFDIDHRKIHRISDFTGDIAAIAPEALVSGEVSVSSGPMQFIFSANGIQAGIGKSGVDISPERLLDMKDSFDEWKRKERVTSDINESEAMLSGLYRNKWSVPKSSEYIFTGQSDTAELFQQELEYERSKIARSMVYRMFSDSNMGASHLSENQIDSNLFLAVRQGDLEAEEVAGRSDFMSNGSFRVAYHLYQTGKIGLDQLVESGKHFAGDRNRWKSEDVPGISERKSLLQEYYDREIVSAETYLDYTYDPYEHLGDRLLLGGQGTEKLDFRLITTASELTDRIENSIRSGTFLSGSFDEQTDRLESVLNTLKGGPVPSGVGQTVPESVQGEGTEKSPYAFVADTGQEGILVTSDFGYRMVEPEVEGIIGEPYHWATHKHTAVDASVRGGSEYYAPLDGELDLLYRPQGRGLGVEFSPGCPSAAGETLYDDKRLIYWHNSPDAITDYSRALLSGNLDMEAGEEANDFVPAGTVIGRSNTDFTGAGSGAHLDLQYLNGGSLKNPLDFYQDLDTYRTAGAEHMSGYDSKLSYHSPDLNNEIQEYSQVYDGGNYYEDYQAFHKIGKTESLEQRLLRAEE